MKFLKYLFTVPEGEKVTERHLKRVLISSVCGILLCMTCLVSSTWAWYTATVQVPVSPITVAEHSAEVYVGDAQTKEEAPAVILADGETKDIKVVFGTDADVANDSFTTGSKFGYEPGRYIIVTVTAKAANAPETAAEAGTEPVADTFDTHFATYCIPASYEVLRENDTAKVWLVKLQLQTGASCKVEFSTAWHIPENVKVLELGTNQLSLVPARQTDENTDTPDSVTTETPGVENTEGGEQTGTDQTGSTQSKETGTTPETSQPTANKTEQTP